jgi:hypothetical protein
MEYGKMNVSWEQLAMDIAIAVPSDQEKPSRCRPTRNNDIKSITWQDRQADLAQTGWIHLNKFVSNAIAM